MNRLPLIITAITAIAISFHSQKALAQESPPPAATVPFNFRATEFQEHLTPATPIDKALSDTSGLQINTSADGTNASLKLEFPTYDGPSLFLRGAGQSQKLGFTVTTPAAKTGSATNIATFDGFTNSTKIQMSYDGFLIPNLEGITVPIDQFNAACTTATLRANVILKSSDKTSKAYNDAAASINTTDGTPKGKPIIDPLTRQPTFRCNSGFVRIFSTRRCCGAESNRPGPNKKALVRLCLGLKWDSRIRATHLLFLALTGEDHTEQDAMVGRRVWGVYKHRSSAGGVCGLQPSGILHGQHDEDIMSEWWTRPRHDLHQRPNWCAKIQGTKLKLRSIFDSKSRSPPFRPASVSRQACLTTPPVMLCLLTCRFI